MHEAIWRKRGVVGHWQAVNSGYSRSLTLLALSMLCEEASREVDANYKIY